MHFVELFLLEHFRNHVEDLIANLGSEFISVDNDDQIEETVAQLKVLFFFIHRRLYTSLDKIYSNENAAA